MPYDTGWGPFVNSLTNPPNPLNQFGGTVDLANKVKDFQANKAIADIYGQSIDPETGQVDLGKFNALASQNPAAMWKFGAQQQQAGTGVQAQGHGTSAQLQAQLDQLGVQQAYLSPLLPAAQAGTLTIEQLQEALRNIPPGVISPTTMANVQRQLANGADPNKIVIGGYFASEEARRQAQMAQPSLGMVPSGSLQYPTQGNIFYPGGPGRAGGIQYPQQAIPQGTQPGGTDIDLGGGQHITVPNDQVHRILTDNPNLQKLNQKLLGGGGAGAAPQPAPAPSALGAPGPGRYGYQPAPSGAPAPASPPPSPSAPATPTSDKPLWLQPPDQPPAPPQAGGVGVSTTPQYQEGVSTITKAASANAAGLANLRGATTDQIPLYDDIERVLNQQGVVSGVGAPQISKLRQAAINMGLVAPEPGQKVDLSSPQAAQEELVKDSALLTRAGIGAMGNPTDARQELITESTPGQGLSKQGNLNITRMLKGNAQAIQVMDDAWNRAKKEAQWTAGGDENNNFNTWRDNKFLATDKKTEGRFDPTVFWVANQPNLAAQKEYIAKISDPAAQKQLIKNLKYATQQGWIKKRDDGSATVVPP